MIDPIDLDWRKTAGLVAAFAMAVLAAYPLAYALDVPPRDAIILVVAGALFRPALSAIYTIAAKEDR